MPRLLDEHLGLEAHVQSYDFREELFFGLGPDSARSDLVTYRHAQHHRRRLGGRAPHLVADGQRCGRFSESAGQRPTDEEESIGSRFDDSSAPGLANQPKFMRYEATVDVNRRDPRGNPRSGGRYLFTTSGSTTSIRTRTHFSALKPMCSDASRC